jgi:predicted ATPase
VNILATSREPLRASGEREYRLAPLGFPETSSRLTAAEAAAFPAVQLFVERASAIVEDFALTDANAPAVVEICRRLDGLPLAIEFAAPRVAVLGIEGLAARLNDSLQLLGRRRRAATPRHQTMRAVVDWSYSLLSEDEQSFFNALGIFAGGFTVEASAAVVPDAAKTRNNAIDRLADLVAKSLVVVDTSGTQPRFRLLDTTRACTIEKLDSNGERERMARRHAEYYRRLFERAEAEAPARPTNEWITDYAREADNLRAALDWAFSPKGDGSIGVALAAAAFPLWIRLSLLEECHTRAKQALHALGTGREHHPREEMRLHAALGASIQNAAEMGAAFTKVLNIAESLSDTEYQLRALRGLYFFHTGQGHYRSALPFAQKFHDLATSGPNLSDRLFGERMLGSAEHFLGDHVSARRHLEQVLSRYSATDYGRDVLRFQDVIRFQTDVQFSARVFLTRVLWVQGFPDQALRTVEQSLGEAQATGHAMSQCYALALAACPISLWTGDFFAAAQYTKALLDISRKRGLLHWAAFGLLYQKALALRGVDIDTGSQLDTPVDDTAQASPNFRSLAGLCDMAEAMVQARRGVEGLAVLDQGIDHSEAGWIRPELLRLRGELLLLQNPSSARMSEDLFREALKAAHDQVAFSWELRAATSLARLLHHQGRPTDAVACLQPVYGRFTEGFGTADLIAAKQLLDVLGGAG